MAGVGRKREAAQPRTTRNRTRKVLRVLTLNTVSSRCLLLRVRVQSSIRCPATRSPKADVVTCSYVHNNDDQRASPDPQQYLREQRARDLEFERT